MTTLAFTYVLWCGAVGICFAKAVIDDPPETAPQHLWLYYPLWIVLANLLPLLIPLILLVLYIGMLYCWSRWKASVIWDSWVE